MIYFETIFHSDKEEYEFMQEKREQPMKEQIDDFPRADVVPKSEVERLKIAYEGSQKTIKGLTEMIREKNKELAKLETHLELHHGERSLNNLIAKEKSEVAREIFEDIELWLAFDGDIRIITAEKFAELKKKHAGSENG